LPGSKNKKKKEITPVRADLLKSIVLILYLGDYNRNKTLLLGIIIAKKHYF